MFGKKNKNKIKESIIKKNLEYSTLTVSNDFEKLRKPFYAYKTAT